MTANEDDAWVPTESERLRLLAFNLPNNWARRYYALAERLELEAERAES